MLPMGGAPTGGAVRKAWGSSNHGFPCCWGTLSESFATLSDAIFFQTYDRESRTDVFIINQFTSADGTFLVRARNTDATDGNLVGVRLEQKAEDYISDEQKTSTIVVRRPEPYSSSLTFTLKIRVPAWLQHSLRQNKKATVTLTTKTETASRTHEFEISAESEEVASGYFTLTRDWTDGDKI